MSHHLRSENPHIGMPHLTPSFIFVGEQQEVVLEFDKDLPKQIRIVTLTFSNAWNAKICDKILVSQLGPKTIKAFFPVFRQSGIYTVNIKFEHVENPNFPPFQIRVASQIEAIQSILTSGKMSQNGIMSVLLAYLIQLEQQGKHENPDLIDEIFHNTIQKVEDPLKKLPLLLCGNYVNDHLLHFTLRHNLIMTSNWLSNPGIVSNSKQVLISKSYDGATPIDIARQLNLVSIANKIEEQLKDAVFSESSDSTGSETKKKKKIKQKFVHSIKSFADRAVRKTTEESNEYGDTIFLEHLKKTALYSATVVTEYICHTQMSGDVYLKVGDVIFVTRINDYGICKGIAHDKYCEFPLRIVQPLSQPIIAKEISMEITSDDEVDHDYEDLEYVELSKDATAKDRQATLEAKKQLGFLTRSCSVESAIGTSHYYKEQPPPLPPKRNENTSGTLSTVTDRKMESTSKPVLMPKQADKNQLEKLEKFEPVPTPVTYSRHDFSQLQSKVENSVLYARSQALPHPEGHNQQQSPTLDHSPRDRKSNTSESSEHTDEVERAPRPLPALPSKSKHENKSAHNQGLLPYQKHSWEGQHLNEGTRKTTESPSSPSSHNQRNVSKFKSSQPPLPGPKPQKDLSQQTPYQKHSWEGPHLNEVKRKTAESPTLPGGHNQTVASPYQRHTWEGPHLNEGTRKTAESPSLPEAHNQMVASPYQKHSWGGPHLNDSTRKTAESPSLPEAQRNVSKFKSSQPPLPGPKPQKDLSQQTPYQKHSWEGPHLNEGKRKTAESPSLPEGHNQTLVSPYQKHSWEGPHLNEDTRKTTESPSLPGGHNQRGVSKSKPQPPPLPGPKPQQTESSIYESKEQTPQPPPIPIKTHVGQTEQKRKPLLPPPKLKNSKQCSPPLPVSEKPKVPPQDVDSNSDDDIDEYLTFTSTTTPIDIEETYDDIANVRIPGRTLPINPTPVSFQQPSLRPKLSLPNEKKQYNTSQQLYTAHTPPSSPTQELTQPKKPLTPPTSKKPPHVPTKTGPLPESPLLHRWQKQVPVSQSDNVPTKQSSGTKVGLLIQKMNKEIY